MQLHEITKEFKVLSPLREAAAYEALWDNAGASVKRIAEKVMQAPDHIAPFQR